MTPSREHQCSPLPEESREWQLLPNQNDFFASLLLASHALGSLALYRAAAEPPFSVSDTSNEDISYGNILQLDTHTHTPPQERHHFCSFLGVTCTKRQQLSTRRLGKAEAHPRAPCGKPPVPHSPSLGGAGKLPLALQFPAVPAGACAELAGCLYRGKGRRKAILNVKQAEKTLVPASFPRPALAVKAKRSFDSALRFTLKL